MRCYYVSTHSRPKAAGLASIWNFSTIDCFNTQPPEGGWGAGIYALPYFCGFNTQPPEGGWFIRCVSVGAIGLFQHTAARRRLAGGAIRRVDAGNGFNTQPPEGGWGCEPMVVSKATGFQHTAARRRLEEKLTELAASITVSTHSRPKAAGNDLNALHKKNTGFNTQPPEGGWLNEYKRKGV